MSEKKTIFRKCCVCRKLADRNEFVKITAEHSSKNLVINGDSNVFGRSVYVCKSKECIEKSLKKNLILNRLKIKPTENAQKQLEKIRAVLVNILVLNI